MWRCSQLKGGQQARSPMRGKRGMRGALQQLGRGKTCASRSECDWKKQSAFCHALFMKAQIRPVRTQRHSERPHRLAPHLLSLVSLARCLFHTQPSLPLSHAFSPPLPGIAHLRLELSKAPFPTVARGLSTPLQIATAHVSTTPLHRPHRPHPSAPVSRPFLLQTPLSFRMHRMETFSNFSAIASSLIFVAGASTHQTCSLTPEPCNRG